MTVQVMELTVLDSRMSLQARQTVIKFDLEHSGSIFSGNFCPLEAS